MTTDEAFQILELPTSATFEDVKESYKLLSTVWHPDRFKSGGESARKAEEKLKQINMAFAELKRAFENGGFQATKNSGNDQKQAGQERQIYTFEAQYLGNDPRISTGIAKCKLVLNSDFIVLFFSNNNNITYSSKTLTAVVFNQVIWSNNERLDKNLVIKNDRAINNIRMYFTDPDKIVHYFEVKLHFENTYYFKLSLKRIKDTYHLREYTPKINDQRQIHIVKEPMGGCAQLATGCMIVVLFVLTMLMAAMCFASFTTR